MVSQHFFCSRKLKKDNSLTIAKDQPTFSSLDQVLDDASGMSQLVVILMNHHSENVNMYKEVDKNLAQTIVTIV